MGSFDSLYAQYWGSSHEGGMYVCAAPAPTPESVSRAELCRSISWLMPLSVLLLWPLSIAWPVWQMASKAQVVRRQSE